MTTLNQINFASEAQKEACEKIQNEAYIKSFGEWRDRVYINLFHSGYKNDINAKVWVDKFGNLQTQRTSGLSEGLGNAVKTLEVIFGERSEALIGKDLFFYSSKNAQNA